MFLVICFLLSGCSFFSDTVSVTVSIPEGLFPWEEYGSVKNYLVEYPDPYDPGRKIVKTAESEISTLKIRIPKGYYVPVAVFPDTGAKPAGAVYPYNLEGKDVLVISAVNGFIAEILLNLLPEKTRAEGVNIRKIIETIQNKYIDNPWCLDPEILMRSIILGSLSSYSIKCMDTTEASIGGCGGRWISGNPFLKGITVPDAWGSLIFRVYPGTNGYLDIDSGRRLFIDAGDGTFSYIIIP